MKKLIQNQMIKVMFPALLGALATYMATAYPYVYQMVCSVGAS